MSCPRFVEALESRELLSAPPTVKVIGPAWTGIIVPQRPYTHPATPAVPPPLFGPPRPAPPPPSTPPAVDTSLPGTWTGAQSQVDGPGTGAMSLEIGETTSGVQFAVIRIVARGGTIERRAPLTVKKGRLSVLSIAPQLAVRLEGSVDANGRLTGTVQYWTTKSTYKAAYALTKNL